MKIPLLTIHSRVSVFILNQTRSQRTETMLGLYCESRVKHQTAKYNLQTWDRRTGEGRLRKKTVLSKSLLPMLSTEVQRLFIVRLVTSKRISSNVNISLTTAATRLIDLGGSFKTVYGIFLNVFYRFLWYRFYRLTLFCHSQVSFVIIYIKYCLLQ